MDGAVLAEIALKNPDAARVITRYELWRRALWIPTIAVFVVPIEGLVQISHALAGKTTGLTITISVVVSITVSAAHIATVVKLMTKSSSQRRDLIRQREVITRLENELAACQDALP